MTKKKTLSAINENKDLLLAGLLVGGVLFASAQLATVALWKIIVVGIATFALDIKTIGKLEEQVGGLISFFVAFLLFPFPSNIIIGPSLWYTVSRRLGPIPLGTIFLATVYSIGKFFI